MPETLPRFAKRRKRGFMSTKNLIAWLSVLWAAEYTELLLIPTAHIKAEGRGAHAAGVWRTTACPTLVFVFGEPPKNAHGPRALSKTKRLAKRKYNFQ